jgi:hypothetical protein
MELQTVLDNNSNLLLSSCDISITGLSVLAATELQFTLRFQDMNYLSYYDSLSQEKERYDTSCEARSGLTREDETLCL